MVPSETGPMASSRTERPPCKYGAKCYRASAEHLLEFSHPQVFLPEKSESIENHEAPKEIMISGERPPCKYGAKCYRTNEEHVLEFSHPQGFPPEKSKSIEDSKAFKDATDSGVSNLSHREPSLHGTHQERSGHSSEHPAAGQNVGGALARLKVNAAEISTGNAAGEFKSPSSRTTTTAGSDGGQRAELLSAPNQRSEFADAPRLGTRSESGVVLLVLVGLPGSGKSTFCENLLASPSQPWTRVCQDVLKSRKACLKYSKRALEEKRSVLVDRCNFDVDQRSDFLKLAGTFCVEAHALVLDLPQSLCVERASKRIGHEGKVEGDGAKRVVGFVSRGRKFPSLAEGFHRITFCRTDSDVERALQQYRELGHSEPLGPGVFGDVGRARARTPQASSSGSRSVADEISNDSMRNKDKKLGHGGGKPNQGLGLFAGKNSEQEPTASTSTAASDIDDLSYRRRIEEDGGARTLAFPSISTADFQFDDERASSVLVDAVAEFFLATENSKLRLILIDLTSSAMLSKARTKASERGLDSQRFFTHVGDITKLRSSDGPGCNVIANAANWRLKAGGGGVNAAIYSAAGADLERATKAVAQTLKPGESIVVGLPESSPLHQREGVTHVIHVLGPNMNPQRPNCLSGDYDTGCRILRNAYTSLFKNFSSLGFQNVAGSTSEAGALGGITNHNPRGILSGADLTDTPHPPRKNAFAVLMQASRRNLDSKSSSTKPSKIRVTEELAARASKAKETPGFSNHHVASISEVRLSETGNEERSLHVTESGPDITNKDRNGSNTISEGKNSQLGSGQVEVDSGPDGIAAGENGLAMGTREDTFEPRRVGIFCPTQQGRQEGIRQDRKKWQPWTMALFNTAMNPGQHMDVVIQTTDDAVVIRDAYPKAKQHMLVLARKSGLDGIEDLRFEHVPILKHLHDLGEELAVSSLKSDPSLIFRLGYHSVPSMRQLHLHVISQDFDSMRLKNKKHWNSFTTSFFLDSVEVIRQLEEKGEVQVAADAAESMLDMELRCHRCKSAHPNLARLKQHICRCSQPFPNNVHLISSGGNSVQRTS